MQVLLNGAEVTGTVDVHHNDRLCIGTNYFFVVVNPPEQSRPPAGGWPVVDWDMLNREIAKAQGLSVDLNWGALSEDERRRALLNDELVQVAPFSRCRNKDIRRHRLSLGQLEQLPAAASGVAKLKHRLNRPHSDFFCSS